MFQSKDHHNIEDIHMASFIRYVSTISNGTYLENDKRTAILTEKAGWVYKFDTSDFILYHLCTPPHCHNCQIQ